MTTHDGRPHAAGAAAARSVHFLVPGPIDQRTGGYLYDARIADELRRLGWQVRVHGLAGSFPEGDARARTALAEALESIPDRAIVVVDGLAMGALPGPIRAHAERLAILGLVHHPLADERGLASDERERLRESEREALSSSRGVIVTSPFTADRVRSYGLPKERVRVVRPGTDPAPIAEGPGRGAPPALICVGMVTPRKGHDVLVRALARIRDLRWTCVCAGSLDRDVAYAESVLAGVAKADLGERIRFIGECEDDRLRALYHGASLFVLASYYEGYGMAFAEAIARGLPVVGTTGGAIPGTVPPDAGMLVEPGDDEAMAQALRTLLRESADGGGQRLPELARLSLGARRAAGDLPTWRATAAAFAEAVRDLAAEPRD